MFEHAIAEVGRNADESRRLAAEAFQLFLAERHKVSFFDDALDVLERLALRHTLGALTNGNADIARLGLDRFFRFAFSRRRCRRTKTRTGDVPRRTCFTAMCASIR